MRRIELGGIITLVIAVATAAVYIADLLGQVSTLKNRVEAIEKLNLGEAEQRLREAVNKYAPVPPKAILAWAGQPNKVPAGWVVCGQNGTLNLDGLFLIGTNDWSEIGDLIGDKTHQHDVEITSGWDHDGKNSEHIEAADNWNGTNWNHKHRVDGDTQPIEHIPPSAKVFFLCKE